jgi:hypothetical protein
VTIQQLTESNGTSRFPVETWTTLIATYWCSKQDAGGRERFAMDQQSAAFDTRWEGAYVASLDPETVNVTKTRRILYQGRVYDIVAASQVGRRAAIEFLTLSRMGA